MHMKVSGGIQDDAFLTGSQAMQMLLDHETQCNWQRFIEHLTNMVLL